jgi:hypothetical protein
MPSRHDHLINSLFKTDEDRALARAFVARAETDPLLESRIDPLLREAAKTAERVDGSAMTPEQSWDYLTSFAREALGVPEHMVTQTMEWLGGLPEVVAETEQELRDEMPPEAQMLIEQHDRSEAKKDVARFEKMMRESPSEYWRPENQQAYRQALERSLGPQARAPAPQESTAADEVRAAVLGTDMRPQPLLRLEPPRSRRARPPADAPTAPIK